jgi:hypothetical protein
MQKVKKSSLKATCSSEEAHASTYAALHICALYPLSSLIRLHAENQKIFWTEEMDALEDQIKALELANALSPKTSASVLNQRLIRVVEIIRTVSSKFSVLLIGSDLLKFVAACSQLNEEDSTALGNLVELLISRFGSSFRPGAKDCLNIFVAAKQTNATWCYPALLKLLNFALRNQLSNPKNVFLIVSDDFLPHVRDLDEPTLVGITPALHSIVSAMFQSSANVEGLSSYLRSLQSATPPETAAIGKKRKADDAVHISYSAHLFTGVGQSQILAKIVLSEFAQRLRSTDDDDDFLLFSRVLDCLSFDGQIELWKHMSSELRIYRLRAESGEKHREALSALLTKVTGSDISAATAWKGLGAVVEIDPWNFMESVLPEILNRLPSDLSECQDCLLTLFRTFAVKGSLADLVTQILEFGKSREIQINPEFVKRVSFKKELAGVDLVKTLETLFAADNSEFAGIFSEALLVNCLEKVPENYLKNVTELLVSRLDNLVGKFQESKKSARAGIARSMICIVDGLGVVSIAHSLPLSSFDDNAVGKKIEEALSSVARKCSDFRGAALLRLAFLCNTEVGVSDIMGSQDGMKHMVEFVGENASTARAVWTKFRAESEWKNVSEFPMKLIDQFVSNDSGKPKSGTVVIDEVDPISALLKKSRELLAQFPREIFTPVNLRPSSFPSEILALELAWSNQTKAAKQIIDSLDSLEAVYAITVLVEELRRNKKDVSELVTEDVWRKVESFHLLAQARFALALTGTKILPVEQLVSLSTDLLLQETRDRPAVDCAYFCLLQAVLTGTDKRKIRVPWWANKMHAILLAIRGLIGSSISGTEVAAMYVARIWKTIVDSVSCEKIFRISKSVVSMAAEYIRLSAKITDSEAVRVLDRGCCLLLNKLSEQERKYLHALLGKTDREILKRIIELQVRDFKYKGKV